MAPLIRTCCGFLQLQSACKVANPRLIIRSGLNFGSNHLYRYPAVQVRKIDYERISIETTLDNI